MLVDNKLKTKKEKKDGLEASSSLLFQLFEKVNQVVESSVNKKEVSSRAIFFRIVRVLFAVFMIVLGVFLMYEKNTKVSSLQGFINGDLISVNAPIKGKLKFTKHFQQGQSLKSGEKIGTILNNYQDYVSNLEIKKLEIISRIEANQKHLRSLENIIGQRKQMLGSYRQDSSEQKNLRVAYENKRLEQYKDDVTQAESAYKLAKLQAWRLSQLLPNGYVAAAEVDKANANVKQTEAIYEAKKALLDQAASQLTAASKGLQVEGSLTSSYQEAKKHDLKVEILNLEQQLAEAHLQVDLNKAELQELTHQLELQKEVTLLSPFKAVIWSILAKSDEHVEPNKTVMKLINCRERWVEAFVSEKEVGQIYVGAPVTVVSLNADKRSWNGIIKSIRGGDSRVRVGNDTDIMPPELIRRQVALKIEVDWGDDPEQSKLNAREFCMIGTSVEVRFKKQKGLHDGE